MTSTKNQVNINELEPQTVFQVFQKTADKYGNLMALKSANDMHQYSWNEYYAACIAFAKSLYNLKVDKGSSVNIIGFNTPEWLIANNGAIARGAYATGVYTTNETETCKYIAENSNAQVIVVENKHQLDKYLPILTDLPNLKAVVIYSNEEVDKENVVPIYHFEEFLNLGKDVDDNVVKKGLEEQDPKDCCTLIYTYDTTDLPKAVMLSHDNITWTAQNIKQVSILIDHRDRFVSYLPLSHIAAQMLDIHAPMCSGASVYFATPKALKGELGQTLKKVKPTIFFGVSRVWENIMEKMLEDGKNASFVKKLLVRLAKYVGSSESESQQYGFKDTSWVYGYISSFLYKVYNTVIFNKVKQALGLDQCRLCFTGAVPISMETLKYFKSLDIKIYELFGQSECTGPQTLNFPGKWKIGTCGKAIEGTEMKLDEQTGEILYRGRHIFMGYLGMPEKTKETLTKDGWLKSGDIGKIDKDGFLTIVGRIKELIITAGGENIPPVLIEESIKAVLPELANIIVIGNKRKYLTCLMSLVTDLDEEGGPTSKLGLVCLDRSKELESKAETVEQVMECPKWRKYLENGLQVANENTISKAQRVQKYTLLPHDLSIQTGELTPTLKIKRKVVSEKYSELIEAMYS